MSDDGHRTVGAIAGPVAKKQGATSKETQSSLNKVSCLINMSSENNIEEEARCFVERYYKILNEAEVPDSSEILKLYHKSYKRKLLNTEEHGTHMSTLFFDNVGGNYDASTRAEVNSFCVESVKKDLIVVVKGTSGAIHFCQSFYLSKKGLHWVILNDVICLFQNSNGGNSEDVNCSVVTKTVLPLQSEGLNVQNDQKAIDEDIKGETGGHLRQRSRKPPKHFDIEGYEMAYTAMSKVKSKVCIINHPDMLKHQSLENTDEVPQRVRQIMRTLQDDGVLKRCDLIKSQFAAKKDILAVHDAKYLKFVPNQPLEKSEELIFSDYIGEVYFSKGTRDAAFLAAGSVVQGCKLVFDGKCEAAFAVVRPPGHHALPSFADGFCILNNIAIGARYLLSKGLKRIFIVDIDVHHGNGTQEIFYKSNQVLVVSVHSSKLQYPEDSETPLNRTVHCIGEEDGFGYNVNVNLDSGYSDADMLLVLEKILLPLVSEYKPEMILISAGYDAVQGDPLGDALLSAEGIATFIQKLKQLNTGRVILSLEGGYDVQSTSKCVSYTLRALLGDKDVLIQETNLGNPRPLTFGEVKQVQDVLSTAHWVSWSSKKQSAESDS